MELSKYSQVFLFYTIFMKETGVPSESPPHGQNTLLDSEPCRITLNTQEEFLQTFLVTLLHLL